MELQDGIERKNIKKEYYNKNNVNGNTTKVERRKRKI